MPGMLEKRRFAVGDRTVQNRGVPRFILEGDIEVVIEYLRQLWAEDGHFLADQFQARFGWTRAVSLLDSQKDAKYGIHCGITEDMIQLVQEHGRYIECTHNKYHPHYILARGTLKELEKSSDRDVQATAHNLSEIIDANRSELMETERILLSRINVKTQSICREISHFVDTGRVSALWRAKTKTLDDAMRVAILAPPDDIIKKQRVLSWMESEKARYYRIKKELAETGMSDVVMQ